MNILKIGQISAVDSVNFTVNVDFQDGSKATDVQVASQYFDANTGCGFVFVPQEGALCWADATPAGEFIIGGFIAAAEGMLDSGGNLMNDAIDSLGGYNGGRPKDWIPGDCGMVSPEGSYIKMAKGGLVSLVAGELCQVHMLPGSRNMVKMLCGGLEIYSGSGKINMISDNKGDTAEFTIEVQNPKKTQSSIFKVMADKDGGGFSWVAGETSIAVDVEGNMDVALEGDLSVAVGDSFLNMSKDGDMSVDIAGQVVVTSNKTINFNNGNLVIKA